MRKETGKEEHPAAILAAPARRILEEKKTILVKAISSAYFGHSTRCPYGPHRGRPERLDRGQAEVDSGGFSGDERRGSTS